MATSSILFQGAMIFDGQTATATADDLLGRLGEFLGHTVLGEGIVWALAGPTGRLLVVRLTKPSVRGTATTSSTGAATGITISSNRLAARLVCSPNGPRMPKPAAALGNCVLDRDATGCHIVDGGRGRSLGFSELAKRAERMLKVMNRSDVEGRTSADRCPSAITALPRAMHARPHGVKFPISNIAKYGLSLVLCSGLCLLGPGCSRDSSDHDREDDSQSSSWGSDQGDEGQPLQKDSGYTPTDPAGGGSSPTPKAPSPAARPDQLKIDKFSFRFHKESRKEVCGDWDYFVYKGEMTISGRIVSQYPIDMTAPDFEVTIDTPLENYTVPAVYERDDHDDGYQERVIKRRGRGHVFRVTDFRVEDDDLVYRNEDDETGKFKNHGPLLSATFDFDDGTFEISVEREDYSASDVMRGEEFEIQIAMPRADTDLEDFEQTATWVYQGKAINADDYSYDGDCP